MSIENSPIQTTRLACSRSPIKGHEYRGTEGLHFRALINTCYDFYSLPFNKLTDESAEDFCDLIKTHKSLAFLWLVWFLQWCALHSKGYSLYSIAR